MIMWIMSDRTIPRSFRFMEGFGVHTFRLVNAEGKSTFVKFHWKPKLGMQSVVWNEAVKINGADPDFHRRDLWDAIQAGDFPEWELGLQLFDEAFADKFDFDVLDATKIIPEEEVPVRRVGRLVLDRCVDNFFAETEQVAFCTQNIVPGHRLHQRPAAAGPQLLLPRHPAEAARQPQLHPHPDQRARSARSATSSRTATWRCTTRKGRVNYEPNSWGERRAARVAREGLPQPSRREVEGAKLRIRSETFADHYSQARQFYISQTPSRAEAHRRRPDLRAEQGRDPGDPRPDGVAPAEHRRRRWPKRWPTGLRLKEMPKPADRRPADPTGPASRRRR